MSSRWHSNGYSTQSDEPSIAVMLVHTYHGYHATGGPVGVGVATGDAVRLSPIVVVVITLFISLAVYGATGD